MLTMDKDFGELVHKLSMQHSGVLILRMEDAKGAKKAEPQKSGDTILNSLLTSEIISIYLRTWPESHEL